MSWREQIEPDWFHEAPFYLAAIIAHGALLSFNPVISWGGLKPEKAIPVEFVAEIPLPPPVALPIVQPRLTGGDGSNLAPKHGPGVFEREKIKRGAVDAPPKPKPNPKPAAVKSKREKAGSTVHKAKAAAKPRPLARPTVDAEAVKRAREKQAESRRQSAERDRAAKAVVAEKAAAAKAAAVEFAAEKKRFAAERAAEAKAVRDAFAAQQKLERERRAAVARAEAERRAEAARDAAEQKAAALAERKRVAAELKAVKAAKRAELSSALATMEDPDEILEAGAAPAPSGRGSARAGRPAAGGPVAGKGGDGGAFGDAESGDGGGKGGGEAELAGARKAGAAAALAESADPGDAAGSGGSDLLDSKAKGGGIGPEGGGGVSFSVDGPLGSRRILVRVSPTSPDWVATRNLSLSVTVRFQVLPNGSVKNGAVISKTSGFPDIDARAIKALSRWRFQPVTAKTGGEEVWGRVTFRFTS